MKNAYQVIIIGAGPTGIGVASALQEAGITDFIVVDRESEVGGVPRHCHHPSFGLKTYYRPLRGPHYLKKILAPLSTRVFLTRASIVALEPNGSVVVSSDQGLRRIVGERVVIATGARETPRHPRLISGLRPQGIMTTGALQQMMYLHHRVPCRAPVIVGTELVSFSAFWTLKSAGIQPLAMIEANPRPSTWQISRLLPPLLGTPVHCASKISEIGGLERVSYVDIDHLRSGKTQRIACDSVIFSGQFVGEYTLIRHSHLAQNRQSGCPISDQFGRCSDERYFAAGNLLHPVETGEQCHAEGRAVGRHVTAALRGTLPAAEHSLAIHLCDSRLRVVMPSCLAYTKNTEPFSLRLRTAQHFSGEVIVRSGDEVLYQQRHHCLAEQGLILNNVTWPHSSKPLEIVII